MSYFVVVWGTHHHRLLRGVVLDVCTICRAIVPCTVVDHFKQPHIYFIGSGHGTYLGTTRECDRCHQSFAFSEAAYDDIAAPSVRNRPDVMEQLRATNSVLAGMMDLAARLRGRPSDPNYRTPAAEPSARLPRALDRLEKLLLRGHDVKTAYDRLQRWDKMPEPERSALLDSLLPKKKKKKPSPSESRKA